MFVCRRTLPSALVIATLLYGPLPQSRPLSWAQEEPAQESDQSAAPKPAAPQDETDESKEPDQLGTARQTMHVFIVAMETRDYRTAVTALDFSDIDPAPDPYRKVTYAQRLKACLDRLALIDPSLISDEPDGPPLFFPPGQSDSPIVVSRCEDGKWRFSAETVADIDALFEVLKDRPVLGQVVTGAGPTADEHATLAAPAESDEPKVESDAAETPKVAVPLALSSARKTMRTLFDAFENRDGTAAVAALDFSELEAKDPQLELYARKDYARDLKEVIERMAVIDYAEISDDPEGPTFRFPPDETNQPIEITRNEAGVWQFSARTVARIPALHAIYKDKPVLNLADEQKPWWDRELFLGNATWRILSLFAAIFVSLAIGQTLRALFKWRADALRRRDHILRSVVLQTLAKAALGICFLVGLHAGVSGLVLEHKVQSLVSTTIHVVFVVVFGYICFRLVDVAVEMLRDLARRTGSTLNDMLVPIVSTALRVTIIVMVVLEIATAISDQPPSAVIAGLGAGGLAIGLAAQDTIKNLFGSVMIFADRPFELGDRIVIDGHDGPVEAVGFRSTRIRTLDGHLVTIPNGEMASRTIHNIGKRPYIRRIMDIRVASDTPREKVQRALDILGELLASHEGMKEELPPRIFLHDFLETAINIRAIYWYHPPAYWDYCEYSQRLNLQVIERFQAEGIRFALPSQRLFLTGEAEVPADRGGQPEPV